MKQVLTILGSTGSIGTSTLDVVARHPDLFEVFALTGATQLPLLAKQCVVFQPQYAVVLDEDSAKKLQDLLDAASCKTQVLFGQDALCNVASCQEVTTVMAAIVGAAGLLPTFAAATAAKTILLANKEVLVMAGELFMQQVQKCHARILPVDSEHNAIFQVLPSDYQGNLDDKGIESIILTASGGPFLYTDMATFAGITPAMAVKHPNWSMGQKISVDSATMMNKGLEVIEARWLFNAPASRIEVVVHPQSVIHSMVRYQDGSVLAQLGNPDMRTPIAYCLGLPNRIDSGVAPLDFKTLGALSFEEACTKRFPCLGLAFEALKTEGDATCVLNAANEAAVAAFLQHEIKYTDIARVVGGCLEQANMALSTNIGGLMEKDSWARAKARELIDTLH